MGAPLSPPRAAALSAAMVCAAFLGAGDAEAATSVDRLADMLADHSSFKVRATAAVALGRTGEPSAVEPLARALGHDGHFAVRAAAASALGRLNQSDGVEPLLEALVDEDPFVAKEVRRALERHHQPSHLRAFERGLDAEDAEVRLAAVQAFGAVLRDGHEPAAARVLEALADEDEPVQAAATTALDRIPHDRALPMLRAGLAGGSSEVRAASARMLARRTDPDNVAPLMAALSRLGEHPSVRQHVQRALKAHSEYVEIERARAEARGEEGPEKRALALRLLAAIGDAAAAPLLERGLRDADSSVRTAAARGAADLGTDKARAMLKAALQTERDDRVKRHIELVLRTMR